MYLVYNLPMEVIMLQNIVPQPDLDTTNDERFATGPGAYAGSGNLYWPIGLNIMPRCYDHVNVKILVISDRLSFVDENITIGNIQITSFKNITEEIMNKYNDYRMILIDLNFNIVSKFFFENYYKPFIISKTKLNTNEHHVYVMFDSSKTGFDVPQCNLQSSGVPIYVCNNEHLINIFAPIQMNGLISAHKIFSWKDTLWDGEEKGHTMIGYVDGLFFGQLYDLFDDYKHSYHNIRFYKNNDVLYEKVIAFACQIDQIGDILFYPSPNRLFTYSSIPEMLKGLNAIIGYSFQYVDMYLQPHLSRISALNKDDSIIDVVEYDKYYNLYLNNHVLNFPSNQRVKKKLIRYSIFDTINSRKDKIEEPDKILSALFGNKYCNLHKDTKYANYCISSLPGYKLLNSIVSELNEVMSPFKLCKEDIIAGSSSPGGGGLILHAHFKKRT
jgi:hypothetical protein